MHMHDIWGVWNRWTGTLDWNGGMNWTGIEWNGTEVAIAPLTLNIIACHARLDSVVHDSQ